MCLAKGIAVVSCALSLASGTIYGRELTLEDRTRAQEAIERVYYSHQIGASKPFEAAMPRVAIESKVQMYLKQSAALAELWHTPVTAEMLEAELARMARGTRMPERLAELFSALDNDSFVIQECLARATLVDRLTRSFHATDPRLHVMAWREAEGVREALAQGVLDPRRDHPRRSEIEITVEDADGRGEDGPAEGRLSAEELERWRERLSHDIREARLEEEKDGFHVRVLLRADDRSLLMADYRWDKQPWSDWWATAGSVLDAATIVPVASPQVALPALSAGAPCAGGSVSAGTAAGAPAEGCFEGDTWLEMNESPRPRSYHTAVWTGSRMVVWGGLGIDSKELGAGDSYDPATDSWVPISDVSEPSPRAYHTVVWTGDRMVVWGGRTAIDGSSGTPLATGGLYDPSTDTWTATSMLGAPTPRAFHTAVWTGSLMLIWGGSHGSYFNTGARYDPSSDTWTPMSTLNAALARQEHTAVWAGGRMVVWGGYNGNNNPSYLKLGGRYDPVTDTWASVTTVNEPTQGRIHHAAASTGSAMIVCGGRSASSTPFGLGGQYDPVADVWLQIGGPARAKHSAVWAGNVMVIWGGRTGNSSNVQFMNSGWRYDPIAHQWIGIAGASATPGSDSLTTVWTGSHVIAWGGAGGSASNPTSLNSGTRVHLATQTATPTSTGPAARRSGHTAVWTGNRMIVWGGSDDQPATGLATGALYDPATDWWTATSTVNAPAARSGHSAIWTGDRMVVWGGINGSPFDTGGRFDPLTDSWASTATAGAPAARSGHTAIWTGEKMVIWGGSNGLSSLDTGGRYDPAADQWQAVATSGAPEPRASHTAVWTGSEMVIWGGFDLFSSLTHYGNGGRYDATSNSWTPTQLVGAPAARKLHTAVWTGQVMVVWGGDATGVLVNGGALYDPTSDSWTPTSPFDSPAPRMRHTAVWTGEEMVVWGGRSGINSLSTGGRLDPAANVWLPTSTTGAPSARYSHSAVWAGELMWVWGGRTFSGDHFRDGRTYAARGSDDADGDRFTECDGDCNDADASAFAFPVEVTGLSFLDRTTLEWDPQVVGYATHYDVARGLLHEFPVGTGVGETCVEPAGADTSALDSTSPDPEQGFWYLVRGRNGCGTGPYQSGGSPTAVCPAVP